MPRPRVATLFLRVTLPDGTRSYLRPVLLTNGRLRPQWATHKGQSQHFANGVYWLRYTEGGKPNFERIGASAEQAMAKRLQHENGLEAIRLGLTPAKAQREHLAEPRDGDAPSKGTVTIAAALRSWEVSLRRRKCTDKTIAAFLGEMKAFTDIVKKVYVEEITRKDIGAYISKLDADGYSPKTIENRVGTIRAFLYSVEESDDFDVKLPSLTKMFSSKDRPEVPEPNPEVYTDEEIQALMAASSPDDRLLWEFFLSTAFREQEVMYATWANVNHSEKTVSVSEKTLTINDKKFRFTIKNRKGRSVPVSAQILAKLKAKAEQPGRKGQLIFPTATGEPNGHFLRKLKAVAWKAGLNCGNCPDPKKGSDKTCSDGPWCSHWQLHAFRRTMASAWHHREGEPLDMVRRWLGHAKLDTTSHYLEQVKKVTPESHLRASSAFERLVGG